MKTIRSKLTPSKIADFCQRRLVSELTPDEITILQHYLCDLLNGRVFPPFRGSHFDHRKVAEDLGMAHERLSMLRPNLQPLFDAVAREIADIALKSKRAGGPEVVKEPTRAQKVARKQPTPAADHATVVVAPARRGRSPKIVVEFPEALQMTWEEMYAPFAAH